MATSFFKRLQDYPPVRCRLLAVKYPLNTRYQWPVPLADMEIAQVSGLTVGEVRDLAVRTTWADVVWWKVQAFLKGCRLNFENWSSFARTARLARREKYHYLRRHPLWSVQFEPLVKLWHYARNH